MLINTQYVNCDNNNIKSEGSWEVKVLGTWIYTFINSMLQEVLWSKTLG